MYVIFFIVSPGHDVYQLYAHSNDFLTYKASCVQKLKGIHLRIEKISYYSLGHLKSSIFSHAHRASSNMVSTMFSSLPVVLISQLM